MQTPALTNAAIFAPRLPRRSSSHNENFRFWDPVGHRCLARRAIDTARGRAWQAVGTLYQRASLPRTLGPALDF